MVFKRESSSRSRKSQWVSNKKVLDFNIFQDLHVNVSLISGKLQANLRQISWKFHENLMKISCKSHANLMQISCKSHANLPNLMQILHKSHANLMQKQGSKLGLNWAKLNSNCKKLKLITLSLCEELPLLSSPSLLSQNYPKWPSLLYINYPLLIVYFKLDFYFPG